MTPETNEFLAKSLQLQIVKKPDPGSDIHVFEVNLWEDNLSLNKIMRTAFEDGKGK